jgi:hypothetical protein
MRKRWLLGFGVPLLLLTGALLFLLLRGPAEQPRYLDVKIGMTWDQAEEILGEPKYGTWYQSDGLLEKAYDDVDGRVRVSIDGEVVVAVQYIPNEVDTGFFARIARGLRW